MKTVWILVAILHLPPSDLWDDGRRNPALRTHTGELVDVALLNEFYETKEACEAHIGRFDLACLPLRAAK